MQRVYGAQLILGDTVRTAEVIGLRLPVLLILGGIPQVFEYTVNLFLGENTIYMRSAHTAPSSAGGGDFKGK
jgi:hypothetical protein